MARNVCQAAIEWGNRVGNRVGKPSEESSEESSGESSVDQPDETHYVKQRSRRVHPIHQSTIEKGSPNILSNKREGFTVVVRAMTCVHVREKLHKQRRAALIRRRSDCNLWVAEGGLAHPPRTPPIVRRSQYS
jgi:hypothetical protein